MADEATNNQLECVQVTDALEVEKLDINLFRSPAQHLWIPRRARGVFGGQVISQALVSATNCVEPSFSLHSMHCYFLLSATPAAIMYHVERVRDGRSYATRAVRAQQNGKMVFIMLCSFQKPEPWQVSVKLPPPPNVPRPDECEFIFERPLKQANNPQTSARMRDYLMGYVSERQKSFLRVKLAGIRTEDNGQKYWLYWYKVNGMPECSSSFQKCILSYISDSHFIGVAGKTAELEAFNPPGPRRLGMMSSLDHSIFFYNDDFNCGDWMLYVITAPSIGSGRGVVHGRMYTEGGELVAVMTQEGVVRADIRDPSKSKL